MKYLIIGSGYVSQAYQRYFELSGRDYLVASRRYTNYYDTVKLACLLEYYRADVVINCAGYTGVTVDDCERFKATCFEANRFLPLQISKACSKHGNVKLIHISSGCIFDGPGPFTEGSERNNSSYYAICKENAELVLKDNKDAWIFRIRMPFSYAPHPRNWITKLSKYPEIIDGLNSVTWLDEFVGNSIAITRAAPSGIYNSTQVGSVKTMDVAEYLYTKELRGKPTAMNVEEFNKTHVKRSAAVLDVSRYVTACRELGRTVSTATESVRSCIDSMARNQKTTA